MKKFWNLFRGADHDQLPTVEQNPDYFDPMAALDGMGITLPEEIDVAELTEHNDGDAPVREVREYGVGVDLPPNDAEVADEEVLGAGAGTFTPGDELTYTPDIKAAPNLTLGAGSVLAAVASSPAALDAVIDPYARERAEQKDGALAMRFNEGKIRYDLIPPEAIEGLGGIYTMGAKKYADRNWEKGLKLMACFASLMRHAWKWAKGEDLDEESGMHHMDHVAWNAVAISTFFKRGRTDLDDRPTSNP